MAEMTTTIYDLTVIGAGPGGYEAALEAAKLGLRTALIEKDSLGGTCLNRGCIPTKTLLHSSELYKEICDAERFGISAENVRADLNDIQQHKQTTITTLQKGIAALLKAAKVTVYQGLGTVIDTGNDASDNEGIKQVRITSSEVEPVTIKTRQILLASGSVPSVPPIPGHDLPGVMTSDELLSWDQEPFSSLLIIGGGVIGVEFAGIWQALGTKVTILEALPSLIANMDKELGQSLKQSLKKKGADIHTGAKVQSLKSADEGILCTYTEKDTVFTCTAQAVLIATGRKPYTDGLFADSLAPSMERGRILTDEHFQTNLPGIYAIGDVNGKLQLAHAATAQGLHAVHQIAAVLSNGAVLLDHTALSDHASNSAISYTGSPVLNLVPSCIYASPEIASVGLTLDQAKEQGLAAKSHKILSSANGKSVLSLQERGFMKVIYLEETHVIIGAQLLCARATDMISEFAVAIAQKLTLEEMASVIRPHPSFSEMITQATTL